MLVLERVWFDCLGLIWLGLFWYVLCCFEFLVEQKYEVFYVRVCRSILVAAVSKAKAIKCKAAHPDVGRARSFQKSSLSCNNFSAFTFN